MNNLRLWRFHEKRTVRAPCMATHRFKYHTLEHYERWASGKSKSSSKTKLKTIGILQATQTNKCIYICESVIRAVVACRVGYNKPFALTIVHSIDKYMRELKQVHNVPNRTHHDHNSMVWRFIFFPFVRLSIIVFGGLRFKDAHN